MNYPVDLGLFAIKAHNPGFHDLQRSMAVKPARPLLDFCVPVNPYFPTPAIHAELAGRLGEILRYYPTDSGRIGARLAGTLGLDPETVVVGNGSTELITWIDHLFVRSNLITSVPTFGRWTDQPAETGKKVLVYRRTCANGYQIVVDDFIRQVREQNARVAVISNPNNPTGALLPLPEVRRLVAELADLDLIVIDESFIEFSEDEVPTFEREVATFSNALVLKSLGKNFGLHGVRLGYAVAHPDIAGRLRGALPKWNVNALGEVMIEFFGRHRAAYEASRRQVISDRVAFEKALTGVAGLQVTPSKANFLYVQAHFEVDGIELRNDLLTRHGVFIRECGNKIGATSNHFRIAVRPPAEAAVLIEALDRELERPRSH